MTKQNILSAWRGAGLIPADERRILQKLPRPTTPTSPPESSIQSSNMESTFLLTSSPPDANTLRSTNINLNQIIAKSNLPSEVQKHIQKLTSLSEQLFATQTLLKRENHEMKRVLSNRKERKTGKRNAIKDKNIISTEEVHDDVMVCESATVETKKRGRKRKLSTSDRAET
jgi:hypothetical protein